MRSLMALSMFLAIVMLTSCVLAHEGHPADEPHPDETTSQTNPTDITSSSPFTLLKQGKWVQGITLLVIAAILIIGVFILFFIIIQRVIVFKPAKK